MPKLTIGMAHFQDQRALWMTVQTLLAKDRIHEHDCELVIVDNSPGSAQGQAVADQCAKLDGFLPVKYVPLTEVRGTSVPRDRIFREATAPAVLVVDCHVLLANDSIPRLIRYWDLHRNSPDIVHGPLLRENLDVLGTHFNAQWRHEMWGTWGQAWICPCREYVVSTHALPTPKHVAPGQSITLAALEQMRDAGALIDETVEFRTCDWDFAPLEFCPACGLQFPRLPWPGHERALESQSFARLGVSPLYDPEVIVPGMGLGLFSCRRDAWPGFPPQCRGFGGEELSIHQAFLQRGGRSICLPWLQWVHLFGHADGIPYPAPTRDKVRNYVLWFRRLGCDVEEIRRHFVDDRRRLEEAEFQQFVAEVDALV